MTTLKLRRARPNEDLPLPRYETAAASGLDLRADIQEEMTLASLERGAIPTGFCCEIAEGFEGQIRPRSGLALKHGITCLNTPGTIDSDYRGELTVILANLSALPFVIKRGDRIAQLVIAPVARAEVVETAEFSDSARGAKGFGSTGTR